MTDDRIRRRRLRGGGLLAAGVGVPAGLWRHGLAQTKKYSRERVGYRDERYRGRTHANCVLYAGHGECATVEGEASPNGWCVQWTPATMGSWAGPA